MSPNTASSTYMQPLLQLHLAKFNLDQEACTWSRNLAGGFEGSKERWGRVYHHSKHRHQPQDPSATARIQVRVYLLVYPPIFATAARKGEVLWALVLPAFIPEDDSWCASSRTEKGGGGNAEEFSLQ